MLPQTAQTPAPSGGAFDQLATTYDAQATDLKVSRWLRQRVWARLARLFPPGAHVLEIGCGTGEDAVWLAQQGVHVTATDASAAMLEVARAKAEATGVKSRIEFRQLDLAQADAWQLPKQAFDGAFSNFGALNCIADWSALGRQLAQAVKPGGQVAFGVMGRFCAWETLWHAAHGDWRTATRRWRGHAEARVGGLSFPVYYPTPKALQRSLGTYFRPCHLLGLGVFLPTADMYEAVEQRPAVLATLIQLEQSSTAFRWLAHLADHYWLELRRLPQ